MVKKLVHQHFGQLLLNVAELLTKLKRRIEELKARRLGPVQMRFLNIVTPPHLKRAKVFTLFRRACSCVRQAMVANSDKGKDKDVTMTDAKVAC